MSEERIVLTMTRKELYLAVKKQAKRIEQLEDTLKKIQRSAEKKGLLELILAEIYVIAQKALGDK